MAQLHFSQKVQVSDTTGDAKGTQSSFPKNYYFIFTKSDLFVNSIVVLLLQFTKIFKWQSAELY